MRTIYVATLFSLSSLVSARALSPIEAIAGLARQKRQDGDDLKIDGVDINYSGCDEINPKTNNKMSKDIANTWDDAIALANAVTEIDTGTDIGSFDCKSTHGTFHVASIRHGCTFTAIDMDHLAAIILPFRCNGCPKVRAQSIHSLKHQY